MPSRDRGAAVKFLESPIRVTPIRLVVFPLALLTFLSAIIVTVVYASDRISLISPVPLLIACLLIYAATLVVLGRYGFLNVRQMETLAATDTLSALPNRRAMTVAIENANAQGQEIAIALIDLDSFKQINDHYGHATGDDLIRESSNVLSEVFEPEAHCYRLGGDEFAAVMIGPIAGTLLEGMCRSLLERLNAPIEVNGRHIGVGASIGLASCKDGEALSPSELLRRSDVAMYMSKRGGKMRCTWFNETFDQRREAVRELEDEMHQALEREEFSVSYQPLVSTNSSDIVAVEALVRWTRSNGESVGPHIFIPIAEESGLINRIGLFVLRQAVKDALRWPGITLSVNISAAQLRNPEFPIKLGEVLETTGFPPERLELEITETCLVLDPVVAERTLDIIRGFGVRVALDDFGTGYASIGFLRQFRFEKLKLDRSLVVDAGEDEGSRAMMASSITVARALKMDVTAEGVETVEQAELVRAAGCDQIQGWLYYRALPAPEVDALINAQLSAAQTNGTAPNEQRSGTAS